MFRLRLAFHRDAPFDRLVVRAMTESTAVTPGSAKSSETIYEHEDHFLRRLIAADLDPGMTEQVVAAVLLAVGRPDHLGEWVPASFTEEQIAILGLNLTPNGVLPEALPLSFHQTAHQFHDFLMYSPTPFVMLSGPEYVCTFINPPYVRLVGRSSADQLLGKRLLDALPELAGQPCLQWLNTTYRTGAIQHRVEMKYVVHEGDTGLDVEVYFDIVYNPIRDASGRVMGVMAQATDVTERVLARQVTEHREQELYRLWAEIQMLYSAAPAGIAVVQARGHRLTRLNRRLAELLDSSSDDLIGRTLASLPSVPSELIGLLEEAASGTRVVRRIEKGIPGDRYWDVNLMPILDAHGAVEAVMLVVNAISAAAVDMPVLATA